MKTIFRMIRIVSNWVDVPVSIHNRAIRIMSANSKTETPNKNMEPRGFTEARKRLISPL